jgi:hypothetical protein
MSYQSRIGDWLSIERLDVAVARAGLLASLLLLGLWFVVAEVFLLAIPVASAIGCAGYLLTRDRRASAVALPTLPRRVVGYLPSLVVLGVAALVVLTWSAGGRTLPAYALTGAIGTVVLAQILLGEDQPATGPLLVQIVLVAIVVRFSALYTTPGFVGVDIWTHVPVFVEGIVRTESLSALDGSKYLLAPFYHVLGAVGTLVVGTARSGVYLSVGLLVALSALFVYATGRLVLPERWALFATALYAFSDQFVRWGLHVIPTGLGLVFFLATVYCVTRLFVSDATPRMVALLAVVSLSVVFTHQVSTTITLLFLAIAAFVATALASIGGRAVGTTSVRTAVALAAVFLLTLAVTLVSWANTPWVGGETFLRVMAGAFRATVTEQAGFLNLVSTEGPGGGASTLSSSAPTLLDQVVPYVDVLGFALLLAVAVFGGLVMLRWQGPADVTYTHLLAAAVMFVVVFGLSLFGIRTFLPGRWLAFLYAPMVVLAAAGVYHLSRNTPREALFALVLVLALAYPVGMAVNHSAAKEAPAFADQHLRYSYTEPEIAAVGTLATIRPPAVNDSVHTDHPYRTLLHRSGGYDAATLVMDERGPVSGAAVIYRDYQSTGPTLFHTRAGGSVALDAGPERVCPAERNRVYANDQVWVCTPSSAAPEVDE